MEVKRLNYVLAGIFSFVLCMIVSPAFSFASTEESASSNSGDDVFISAQTEYNVTEATLQLKNSGKSQVASASGVFSDLNDIFLYKLELKKDSKVVLSGSAEKRISYSLYPSDKDRRIDLESFSVQTGLNKALMEKTLYLNKGTYYFRFAPGEIKFNNLGNFNFKVTVTPSDVSFVETQGVDDDSFAAAHKIDLNKTYKAQLSLDAYGSGAGAQLQTLDTDWYKFTVPAKQKVRINITKPGPTQTFDARLYDSKGNSVKQLFGTGKDLSIMASSSNVVELDKGTYYFNIQSRMSWKEFDGYGAYSISVNDCSLTKVVLSKTSFQQTGKAITPQPAVYAGSKKLVKGTDYTLTYSNNVKPGTAKVTVKGIGNYSGSISKSFKITYKPEWVKVSGKWKYRNSDGSYVKNVAKVISGKTYCFDKSGYLKTGWVKYSNKWYYATSSGVAKTGWFKTGGKWYYFNSAGIMQTGLKTIGKAKYYFNASGVMQTGWHKISGKYYYFNNSGVMQKSKWIGSYYVKANGQMATNTWIGKYHVNASGKWDKTR